MSNIDIAEYVQKLKSGYNIAHDSVAGFDLMINEAKYAGLKQAITSTYKTYYQELIWNGDLDAIVPELKKLREVTNEVKESKVTEYLFITINARQNITFEEIFEVMPKLTKKKWLTDYIYVYEQRSEIQYDYSGYHVHMILKRNGKKLFDIRKEFKSTLKHICDVANPHILNIKNIKDSADLKRRVNYITNFKADVNKHAKQYNDINFREHYKLERYYVSNEHFLEYIDQAVNPDQLEEVIDELHSDLSC